MKVILIKDVRGIGKAGDIAAVSDGHARNFLIPKGFAKEASGANIKELDKKKAEEEQKRQEMLAEAKEQAEKLEKVGVIIKTKSGEGGRLFGSITSKDIADVLLSEHGIEIDKRKILLENPIKQAGTHEVGIKLYHEVVSKIQVTIET